MTKKLDPTHKVVIIGSGVVGAAIADELTQRGAQHVTVIDQGPLYVTGGSSSHAPGFVFQINPSKTMCELAQRTMTKLDALSPSKDEWLVRRVGGLEIATTEEQLAELKRRLGFAQAYGVPASLISGDECATLWPGIDSSKILGALHTPSDGVVHSKRAVQVQAERALANGATFLAYTQAVGIETQGSQLVGVRVVDAQTGEHERVLEADLMIAAGGIWGPTLGSWLGVNLPMQPVAHGFSSTQPLPMFADATNDEACELPMLRHQGAGAYMRQQGTRLVIGAYEHRPLEVTQESLASVPQAQATGMEPAMHTFTPEDFAATWDEVRSILPQTQTAELEASRSFNGIFSFTPDGGPLLGPSQTIDGVWVAQAVWVTHSAGLAQVAAEWLMTGNPGIDTTALDLNRFDQRLLSKQFGTAKGLESYDEVYDVRHPRESSNKMRGLRTSPFHEAQRQLGAQFVEANGWERPLWLEANRRLLERENIHLPKMTSWDARLWSPIAAAEAWATRNRVAMYDMTSLYRLEVSGPDATAFLTRLTTNKVDKAPGSVTYSIMLDDAGGILSDITVTRVEETLYWIGANGPVDLSHLHNQVQPDEHVTIQDITPGTCCIGLWGPHARDVMSTLAEIPVDHDSFGYFKARRFFMAGVPVLALRVSYVGELGWEIYTTADHGRRLWEEIYEAGQQYGIVVGGRLAFNSLRLEKGYRSYGSDMTREHTPVEAGLGFAIGRSKEGYRGHAALQHRQAQATQRLATLTSAIPHGVPNPGSPVFNADGDVVGYTTSADIGYTVGAVVTYAWLHAGFHDQDQQLAIWHFGRKIPATVTADVLVDPEGEKIRV